ncbi:MAG: hypothetical protein LBC29_05675 [Propionibacteriaceae bacterium]|nr:hypothetical protein [Propionibacteriaceae bacterium]
MGITAAAQLEQHSAQSALFENYAISEVLKHLANVGKAAFECNPAA